MIKKTLFLIASIVVALVAGLFIYKHVSERPKTITKYEHLEFGMDMNEVVYNLGTASNVFEEENSEITLSDGTVLKGGFLMLISADELKNKKKTFRDYFHWQYEDKNSAKTITVAFDEKTKQVISIGCMVDSRKNNAQSICDVNGIHTNTSEDYVIKRLGQPSEVSFQGATKSMVYSQLNMKIYLSLRQVYYIKIEKMN